MYRPPSPFVDLSSISQSGRSPPARSRSRPPLPGGPRNPMAKVSSPNLYGRAQAQSPPSPFQHESRFSSPPGSASSTRSSSPFEVPSSSLPAPSERPLSHLSSPIHNSRPPSPALLPDVSETLSEDVSHPTSVDGLPDTEGLERRPSTNGSPAYSEAPATSADPSHSVNHVTSQPEPDATEPPSYITESHTSIHTPADIEDPSRQSSPLIHDSVLPSPELETPMNRPPTYYAAPQTAPHTPATAEGPYPHSSSPSPPQWQPRVTAVPVDSERPIRHLYSPAPSSPAPSVDSRSNAERVQKTSIQRPPPINFDSVPVVWRGLTLDAAQWSFSSGELQQMVSRAIRKSAEESSIRLLPLEVLDRELQDEITRLDNLKVVTQSKYRFNMHRRTMLLQSLNAFAQAPGTSAETIANLASNIAEVTTTCDRLVEELLRTADHQAQIARLLDTHSASALAMALRKLNASYAKRVKEMQELKVQLEHVEAERDDAWNVAEQIAAEIDEEEYADDGEEADADGEGEGGVDDGVEMINITGRAVATTATWTRASRLGVKVPGVGPRHPVGYHRSRSNSAASRVSAARTRSVRASKASLRIPKDMRRSRGPSSPLDALPKHPPLPVPALPKGASFLEMATRPNSSVVPDDEQEPEQVVAAPPLDDRSPPFSAGFADERTMSQLMSMGVPRIVEPGSGGSEGNVRTQSMLPPIRTAFLRQESARPASDFNTTRPKPKRPSSMPISALSPTGETSEKPWGYF